MLPVVKSLRFPLTASIKSENMVFGVELLLVVIMINLRKRILIRN